MCHIAAIDVRPFLEDASLQRDFLWAKSEALKSAGSDAEHVLLNFWTCKHGVFLVCCRETCPKNSFPAAPKGRPTVSNMNLAAFRELGCAS